MLRISKKITSLWLKTVARSTILRKYQKRNLRRTSCLFIMGKRAANDQINGAARGSDALLITGDLHERVAYGQKSRVNYL